jgi:hypothetical protein
MSKRKRGQFEEIDEIDQKIRRPAAAAVENFNHNRRPAAAAAAAGAGAGQESSLLLQRRQPQRYVRLESGQFARVDDLRKDQDDSSGLLMQPRRPQIYAKQPQGQIVTINTSANPRQDNNLFVNNLPQDNDVTRYLVMDLYVRDRQRIEKCAERSVQAMAKFKNQSNAAQQKLPKELQTIIGQYAIEACDLKLSEMIDAYIMLTRDVRYQGLATSKVLSDLQRRIVLHLQESPVMQNQYLYWLEYARATSNDLGEQQDIILEFLADCFARDELLTECHSRFRFSSGPQYDPIFHK